MSDFHIQRPSCQEALDVVNLVSKQPFRIRVGNSWQDANATSVMALVSLDHSCPLEVSADCPEEEFEEFCRKAARFEAK